MKKLITLTSLFITLNLFAQNNSLQFDGINDHINSGTINLSGSAITLETWVKADAFQSNFPYISQIAGTEASGNSAFLRLGDGDIPAGNKVQFVLQFGGSQIKLTSSSTLQTGQWYHIAGTYDGTNMKVYINGAQDASNSQSGSFTSNSTFYLATNDGSGRFLDGTLDEVRVWNDARTETEIRQNIYRELPDPSSETNLIAYYKLNESSGTTASDSKNNYDGTLTNMAGSEWVTESPFEAPKYALDFDGTNDYVQAGAIAFTGSTLTIEAWIRPRTFNDGSDANITDLVKDANEKLVLRIGDGGIENNRLQFVLSIGNTQYKLQANTLLSADTWYHVAAAYDGSNMKLYINGVEDNTTGRTGNIDAGAGNLLIGGNSGGRRLDGKMDEVRIWSTARSASEISSNMTSLLNGFETGLTAYYRFDDGTGTTLTDQKSTYNGTLTNMDNADWVNSYAMVLAEDATDISTTSFTANWDCPGTGSSFDDGYTIQYSTTSDFSSGNNTTTATSSETSKSITGLSAGTTYYYRVSGKRSGDATLEYSNVKSAATTSLISYIVSGAGSSEVNGTYVESGTYNGKTQYRLGSTDYYLRYNGYGSNRWEIWNDNYWETLYYTNVAGDTPPSTGWTTYFGDDPAPSVEISSPSIAYSASEFNESYDDDGSISNNITITCNNVDGVEFTGTNGDNFVTGGK
ncbi:MAG: fibronectin type III domain-containing protein, partial [Melioribacteraceae bacterium]|nr:fibronectin type III domain-containing protein [Melioribacteraceae bacterium]